MTSLAREFFLTSTFTGPWYPGILGDAGVCVGMKSGGVDTLIGELETQLGLVHDLIPYGERIISVAAGLRTYLEKKSAFFKESYYLDPEAVTARLLQWREELLLGGWDGEASVLPERVKTAMEALGESMAMPGIYGRADRVRAILAILVSRRERIFDSVYLLRAIEKEPPLLQKLLAALTKSGTQIKSFALPAPPKQQGDLLKARQAIEDGSAFRPKRDGTLLRLLGRSPYETAEALASWLSERGCEGVVLIADEGLRLELDAAFRRYHLPAIGSTSASVYRSALQILPLALILRWEPLDPSLLLEYLLIPLSPIRPSWGRRLAEAVVEEPGIGGEEWKVAIEKCFESMEKYSDESSDKDRSSSRDRLLAWLPDRAGMLPPEGKIPLKDVEDLCDRLTQWAVGRAAILTDKGKATADSPHADDIALLNAVAHQASAMKRMARGTGLAAFDRLGATKLIETATGGGYCVEIGEQEVEGVRLVGSPAAVLAPADTVIWWNFTADSCDKISPYIFPAEECRLLRGKGIFLPDPRARAEEHAEGWRRPLRYASGQLILAAHEVKNGEPVGIHPLWNELAARGERKEIATITVTPGGLIEDPALPMRSKVASIRPLTPPVPRRYWTFSNLKAGLRDAGESASSLESLVSCPFKYVLKYQANLRPSAYAILPDDRLVQGKFAHRVIQELFPARGTIPVHDELERKAGEIFDWLLPRAAATLCLKGAGGGLDILRKRIVKAAAALGDFLRDNRLRIEGIESEDLRESELGPLNGILDLLAVGPSGEKTVLDMKYSVWGDSTYLKLLREGCAIQLAVYVRLEGPKAVAGYVSLKDAQILTTDRINHPRVRRINGPSMSETWAMLGTTVKFIVDSHFKEGRLCAAGIQGVGKDDVGAPVADGGLPRLEPYCSSCDYGALCGYSWGERQAEE